MWVLLSIISAICLGFYDIAKKRALGIRSVIDVLTMSIICSTILLLPMLILSRTMPEQMGNTLFYCAHVDTRTHGLIFLKACLVLSSWAFSYAALRHLPISLVSPMQATRPMWTLFGALLIFGERLNIHQWLGITCTLGSIFLFSFFEHPKRDSISHGQARFYIYLILAILLGSTSGLYDKYMMRHFDRNAVQVYYTVYQAVLMLIIWSWHHRKGWYKALHSLFQQPFPWSIIAISAFLIISDFVYLMALSYPDSLIAVVSTIRRSGAILPFLYGIFILREPDPWKKALCTAGIILGLIFLVLA